MTGIFDRTEYLAQYGNDLAKQTKALEIALDVRKFEIENYWKRTTYFWTLIGAALVAFFAVAASEHVDQKPTLRLAVACFGFLLATSWYQVNRASKFWQENWERHVDHLEEEIAGPVYELVMPANEYPLWAFWTGYSYSVSRVNQLVSLFAIVLWIVLCASTSPLGSTQTHEEQIVSWMLIGTTLLWFGLLLVLGRSSLPSYPPKPRKAIFVRRSRG